MDVRERERASDESFGAGAPHIMADVSVLASFLVPPLRIQVFGLPVYIDTYFVLYPYSSVTVPDAASIFTRKV